MAFHLARSAFSVFVPAVLLVVPAIPVRSAPITTVSLDLPPSCLREVDAAWQLTVFLVTNFILHAVAAPVAADVERFTRSVTRRNRGYRWGIVVRLVALFLPFCTLARTILLIAEQLKCRRSDLRAALHHGATIVVVRKQGWEPSAEGDTVFVKLPAGFDPSKNSMDDGKTCAIIDVATERKAYWLAKGAGRNLHGVARPPPGYSLAVPLDKAFTDSIIIGHLQSTEDIKIHHPPGFTNMVLSIFQIVFASFTLYFDAHGRRTERWGYASYGLSVFPYAIMSVINVICAWQVGEYPCGHLIRTPILEESMRRIDPDNTEYKYDGVVGALNAATRKVPELGTQGHPGYTAVNMCILGEDEKSTRRLRMKGDTWERDFEICAEGGLGEKTDAVVHLTVSALCHDGHPPECELIWFRRLSWTEVISIATLYLTAMIMPHALIYALTEFRPGTSTVAQRAWMMGWLAADQFSAGGMLISWLVFKYWHDIIPTWFQYLYLVVLSVPALGGFVVIGQMYLQDLNVSYSSLTSCVL